VPLAEKIAAIEGVGSEDIAEAASLLFDESRLSTLVYKPSR